VFNMQSIKLNYIIYISDEIGLMGREIFRNTNLKEDEFRQVYRHDARNGQAVYTPKRYTLKQCIHVNGEGDVWYMFKSLKVTFVLKDST
jgi:hypothetical protein